MTSTVLNALDFALEDLARQIGAEVLGDPAARITRLDTVQDAGEGSLTFVRGASFAKTFAASDATAAIVEAGLFEEPPQGKTLLLVEKTDLAFIKVLELFAPPPLACEPGVHPSAHIHPEARIDPSASVGPFCCVGPRSTIGPGTVLRARVSISEDVTLGAGCALHDGVVVRERCSIGDGTVLHAGVVIGGDGFGYRPAEDGKGLVKVPHLGGVTIGRGVEIGCNTTVDRGKIGNTSIGDGTKIDNLVQIGHNCTIGRCVILCGQVGISGSVTIGDGAILGGQVGVADNVTIGPGIQLAAKAGANRDLTDASTPYMGPLAMPAKDYLRSYAKFRELPSGARKSGD